MPHDRRHDTDGVSQRPMLPPCRVCGEKASGFHYGVNTCEACKAFFRRSLKKSEVYECAADALCEILPGKRSCCAFCRFKKCVAMGMCIDAIQTGRYTHEKRTKNIKEVNEIRKQTQSPMELSSPALSTIKRDDLPKSDDLSTSVADRSTTICSEQSSTASSPVTVESSGEGCVVWFDPNLTEHYETIIQRLTNIHKSLDYHTDEFLKKVPEKEDEFLKQMALQNKVFGPLKTMSRDEYSTFYEATGIDVDGRRDLVTEFVPQLEQSIKHYITFAKAIPGFNSLCVDDQIALIKASRYDSWMITGHKCFIPEHKLIAMPDGSIFSMEELMKLNDRESVDSVFALQTRLKNLNLNIEETSTLGAFAIMFADHCPLKSPEVVESSQEQLLHCLGYLFHKYHPDERLRFARVINCLLQMRSMHVEHIKAEERFANDWLGVVKIPALLCEMWSF